MTQTKVIGEERASIEKMPQKDLAVSKPVVIDGEEGGAQLVVGGAIPGLVSCVGCASKHEEIANEQHPSMASVSAPDCRFLPSLSSLPDCL